MDDDEVDVHVEPEIEEEIRLAKAKKHPLFTGYISDCRDDRYQIGVRAGSGVGKKKLTANKTECPTRKLAFKKVREKAHQLLRSRGMVPR
jgi:hypothetical protein